MIPKKPKLKNLLSFFKNRPSKQEPSSTSKKTTASEKKHFPYFKTHQMSSVRERAWRREHAFQVTPDDFQINAEGSGMDEAGDHNLKAPFQLNSHVLSETLLDWYLRQSFIGYQACAFIAQNWLVDKGCTMKVRDAIRKGFALIFDDGMDISPEVVDHIHCLNRQFQLNKAMVTADKFKNVYGISHNLFLVDSEDPEYYQKPFNPDGIRPNSYHGISHIDPCWISPMLASDNVHNPASRNFYNPEYWIISGRKYHHSHFVILKGPDVSDVLKPSYMYGGIPLPQMVAERVYAAERTANEAPMLAMTKRLVVRHIGELTDELRNNPNFEEALQSMTEFRDNYGVLVLDERDRIDQLETNLTDLDAVIMTQYQIVAGIFGVPATKLMGTSPKGFNATGEHEIDTYHEALENLQENDLTPIVERHHLCLARSHLKPGPDNKPLTIQIRWNPLVVQSDRERAETQEIKARAYRAIQESGAVDEYDIRQAIIADTESVFSGLEDIERPDVDPVQ